MAFQNFLGSLSVISFLLLVDDSSKRGMLVAVVGSKGVITASDEVRLVAHVTNALVARGL